MGKCYNVFDDVPLSTADTWNSPKVYYTRIVNALIEFTKAQSNAGNARFRVLVPGCVEEGL